MRYNTENSIVDVRFNEWTAGLDPKAARIAVFNRIRDIPYMIIPELRSPETGPPGILEKNCGSCQPKHWLLAIFFKKLGIPFKYATYPFYWHEGKHVRYPYELEKLMRDLPITNHLALKADIDGNRILVDATYDRPLEKAGFPVNGSWDGVSPTLNAVHPLEEVLHDTREGRVEYDAATRASYTDAEKTALAEFVPKLNAWFASLRRKK